MRERRRQTPVLEGLVRALDHLEERDLLGEARRDGVRRRADLAQGRLADRRVDQPLVEAVA